MGKDVSLILADSESIIDIIRASRQKNGTDSVLRVLGSGGDDSNFRQYVTEVLEQNVMAQNTDFNTGSGFVASWLLASTRSSWYLRNCSVSLFIETQKIPVQQQHRYISDWAPILKSRLENLDSSNHFTETNYSLGCYISPEHCENFINDYKLMPEFKDAVTAYFGIFTAGLLDAMWSAIETNTGLIESMDLFVPIGADQATGALQFSEQLCYTINTYDQTNYALQIFSIEAQKTNAEAAIYQQQGKEGEAAQCKNRISDLIAMMIKNGNDYLNKVGEKTHLEIPQLTVNDWGF